MDAAWEIEGRHTIDDIYNLPEGQRAELIDGQLYMMAPPGRTHQRIVHFLDVEIGNYIRSRKGDCEVYPALFAVFLYSDDKTYVEPDIAVICDKAKLDERGCKGAPDWTIEVVSPSSHSMDYFTKLFKYRSAGVREYWAVDHDRNLITVYDFEHNRMEEYTFADCVKAGIYEDLMIDFSKMNVPLQGV